MSARRLVLCARASPARMPSPPCVCVCVCRFSEAHGFDKPNDKDALDLMDEAAKVRPCSAWQRQHAPCCWLSTLLLLPRCPPGCPSGQCVLRMFPDVRLAYGESDEYSFVLHKDSSLYGARRARACVHVLCAVRVRCRRQA